MRTLVLQSSTAAANGVAMQDDRLQWAMDSAQSLGLEIYAWMEYGMMAHFGTQPSNSFSAACDAKDWLLFNVGPGGGYRPYIFRLLCVYDMKTFLFRRTFNV